jgi:hypothetical protein
MVTQNGLQVQVSATFVRSYQNNGLWCVYDCHRVATKTYSYVGMNEATARKCQRAKEKQYTRKFWAQSSDTTMWFNPVASVVPAANVTLKHDDGGLWSVDISVNEDQAVVVHQKYDATNPDVDLDAIFDVDQDYDEMPAQGQCLCVTSAYQESGKFLMAYEQSIPNFSSASLVVEISQDRSAWTTVSPSSVTDSLVTFNSGTWQNKYYRLRWGSGLVSNVVAPPDINHTRTIVLSVPTFADAWEIPFTEDFANFDPSSSKFVLQYMAKGDADWSLTAKMVSRGKIVVTWPDIASTAVVQFRARYDGVLSNTVNTLSAMIATGELVASVEQNQVTTVAFSFFPDLADFDPSKISITYQDPYGTRTFSGASVTVTSGTGAEKIATVDVGNVVYDEGQGYMNIKETLVYDGWNVATLTTKAYRS